MGKSLSGMMVKPLSLNGACERSSESAGRGISGVATLIREQHLNPNIFIEVISSR